MCENTSLLKTRYAQREDANKKMPDEKIEENLDTTSRGYKNLGLFSYV
jgi:hypothetical protein